jgi:hypothetical protein
MSDLRAIDCSWSDSVPTDSILDAARSEDASRIRFLGVFASPAVETAFRDQRFRDDRWLSGFLVAVGTMRVALFHLGDYQHPGAGLAFWLLLTNRLLFLCASAWTFLALWRAASPAAADRLFFGWGFLLVAVTVGAISAQPPSSNALLFMSFGMVLVTYSVTPVSLSGQATLALTYSALVLIASRQADSGTLATVAAVHIMAHLFGAVMSWRLNHRRRQMYLGVLREAQLRAELEAAAAEVRTLQGLLHICAWCKRIRDEAHVWESVERYVQSRTEASFSHGICPDCLQSQVKEFRSRR